MRNKNPEMHILHNVDVIVGLVRMSAIAAALSASDHEPPFDPERFDAEVKEAGRECPIHGYLGDPVILLAGGLFVVACPDCSGKELRDLWASQAVES